ncbi:MAG: hypothetical protein QM726_16595 [Chitinophagaceae bacterium]
MLKLFILLSCTVLFFASPLTAQKGNPESAFKYNLLAEPAIVETGDNTVVNVKFDNGTVVNNYPNAGSFPDGSKPAYVVGEYKVLQGGGKLVMNNASTISFTYSAPASIAKDIDKSIVQISVELIPKNDDKKATGGLPKIILYCTMYVVQNETAFEVEMPEAGFDHAKYVSNNKGGIGVPAIDPRIPAAQQQMLQEKMKQMQQMSNASSSQSNINFNGITSNASVLYDPQNDATVINIKQLALQINKAPNGDGYVTNANPTPNAIIVIKFKGKPSKGNHNIDIDPDNIAFTTFTGRACTCGTKKHNEDGKDYPCAGIVNITEVTNEGFRGTLMTRIYYAASGNNLTGYITGKFYALNANNK